MSKALAMIIGAAVAVVGGLAAAAHFLRKSELPEGTELNTVKLGSKGLSVKVLQQQLVIRGYKIGMDGAFGPATDAALRQWQGANGLAVNGVADAAVWAHLAPIATATPAGQKRINKARTALGRRTVYAMGGSGPPRSDCTGLLAFAIGVPRDKSNRIPSSIHTTAIVKDATGVQGMFRKVSTPVPGCIVVYPDPGPGQEGHAGLVTSVYPLRGIDCSSSRYDKTGEAINERDFGFFLNRSDTIFCVLVTDANTANT